MFSGAGLPHLIWMSAICRRFTKRKKCLLQPQIRAGKAGKLVYNGSTKLQKIVVAGASGERIGVNALQKTLAIVALLVLVSQTVRHAYVLWLEPRNSVLDKYDRPLKDEISAATSLDQLLSRYDQAHTAAEAARKEAEKNEQPNPEYKLA